MDNDTQSTPFPSKGRNKARHRRLAALLAGTGLLGFTSAAAGQAVWTGATSTDWANAANWTTPPNATTDVIISDVPLNAPVISAITAGTAGLTVSGASPAALTIVNGGVLTSQSPSFIGFGIGENGSIALDSSSGWTSGDNMFVGFDGNGDLTITGSSAVTANASAYLGFGEQGFGSVRVFGIGSSWDVANTLVVGLAREGVLFAQGGSVSSGEAYLGAEAGSEGWSPSPAMRVGSIPAACGSASAGPAGCRALQDRP